MVSFRIFLKKYKNGKYQLHKISSNIYNNNISFNDSIKLDLIFLKLSLFKSF